MDYGIKKVNRISRFSPNVIAVVNAPELQIPARVYVFWEDLERTFGSLEKAVAYAAERLGKTPKCKEFFQVGFLFGNNYPDKDIFVFPFEYSGENPEKLRSVDYHIKNGEIQTGKTRQKIDEFPSILHDEQVFLRIHGLPRHIANFPDLKISGLEYLTQ